MQISRKLAVTLLAAGVLALPAHAAAPPEQAIFLQSTQALADAIGNGDKAAWDRATAADWSVTSEDGEVIGKEEFLKGLSPLPPGFSGHITVKDLTVKDLGDAAVVHYRMDETETIFGQELHTNYLATDMYRRAGESWQMVASQVVVVPKDLAAVPVDESGWPKLVGTYRVSDKSPRRYHVYLRQDVLYGGSDEKSATRLIPLSPLVFHQSGSIHIMVFVQNGKGAITEMREIHKYNELVYQRAD